MLAKPTIIRQAKAALCAALNSARPAEAWNVNALNASW